MVGVQQAGIWTLLPEFFDCAIQFSAIFMIVFFLPSCVMLKLKLETEVLEMIYDSI